MTVTAECLISPELPNQWHLIRGYLVEACQYSDGKFTPSDLFRAIFNNKMQCWVFKNERGEIIAALVSEIIRYPKSLRLHIGMYGGAPVEETIGAFLPILDWGRANLCEAYEITGRPGWERLLIRFGLEVEAIHTTLRGNLHG